MSAPVDNGGPAFPATNYIIPADLEARHVAALGKTQGMTLRDYFAAKAMTGLLANPGGPVQANGTNGWDFTNCTVRDAADVAYHVADALLAAREAQP